MSNNSNEDLFGGISLRVRVIVNIFTLNVNRKLATIDLHQQWIAKLGLTIYCTGPLRVEFNSSEILNVR